MDRRAHGAARPANRNRTNGPPEESVPAPAPVVPSLPEARPNRNRTGNVPPQAAVPLPLPGAVLPPTHVPPGYPQLGEDYEVEESVPEDMQCSICFEPFLDPIEIQPCGHIFCHKCLAQLHSPVCPTCRAQPELYRRPHRVISSLVGNLHVRCLTCAWCGPRDAMPMHSCSAPPSLVTLGDNNTSFTSGDFKKAISDYSSSIRNATARVEEDIQVRIKNRIEEAAAKKAAEEAAAKKAAEEAAAKKAAEEAADKKAAEEAAAKKAAEEAAAKKAAEEAAAKKAAEKAAERAVREAAYEKAERKAAAYALFDFDASLVCLLLVYVWGRYYTDSSILFYISCKARAYLYAEIYLQQHAHCPEDEDSILLTSIITNTLNMGTVHPRSRRDFWRKLILLFKVLVIMFFYCEIMYDLDRLMVRYVIPLFYTESTGYGLTDFVLNSVSRVYAFYIHSFSVTYMCGAVYVFVHQAAYYCHFISFMASGIFTDVFNEAVSKKVAARTRAPLAFVAPGPAKRKKWPPWAS